METIDINPEIIMSLVSVNAVLNHVNNLHGDKQSLIIWPVSSHLRFSRSSTRLVRIFTETRLSWDSGNGARNTGAGVKSWTTVGKYGRLQGGGMYPLNFWNKSGLYIKKKGNTDSPPFRKIIIMKFYNMRPPNANSLIQNPFRTRPSMCESKQNERNVIQSVRFTLCFGEFV